jgi:hypothetical protein
MVVPLGRVAGQLVGIWGRGSSAANGALARQREKARAQERIREARRLEANRLAAARPQMALPGRPGSSSGSTAAGSRPLPGPVRPRLQNDQPPIAPEPVAVEPFTADPVTVDPPERHDHS